MFWQTRDLYIGDETYKKFFWKKYKDNIYSIFINLDNGTLKYEKFNYFKLEFHMNYEKNFVYFARYIYFKRGRTILSCMKEMLKLLKEWRVDAIGHFVVVVE